MTGIDYKVVGRDRLVIVHDRVFLVYSVDIYIIV